MDKIIYALLFVAVTACNAQDGTVKVENDFGDAFSNYWYAGNAEISSYELKQARYGEFREGEAILVFVTEDFLLKKQVKKESASSEKFSSVLKLNFIRKFPTGIYDYSMMTSTFTPINQSSLQATVKLTCSSQEWCGHSWLQLNQREKERYTLQSYSYFEAEGDREKELQLTELEDGLWTQIRINPELIQVGKRKLFPSAHYLRFAHKDLRAYEAEITRSKYMEQDMGGSTPMVLAIRYPELEREVKIIYESDFPHKILGWKESRNSGGRKMQTVARKKAERKSPYWSENGVEHRKLREELKLD